MHVRVEEGQEEVGMEGGRIRIGVVEQWEAREDGVRSRSTSTSTSKSGKDFIRLSWWGWLVGRVGGVGGGGGWC